MFSSLKLLGNSIHNKSRSKAIVYDFVEQITFYQVFIAVVVEYISYIYKIHCFYFEIHLKYCQDTDAYL